MDQLPLWQINQFLVYAGVVDDAKEIRATEAAAQAKAEAARQAARGR